MKINCTLKTSLIIILFILLSQFLAAENSSKIKHEQILEFSCCDYPPLIGENLAYNGILTRIVTEAFATQGIKIHINWFPNYRAINGAISGQFDGTFGWGYTPERAKSLLYSKNIIYKFKMGFFHKTGKTYSWSSLKELAPYKIGATLGNFYSDEFSELANSKQLNIESAPSDELNIRKLAAGRIDLFPMELEAGIFLINSMLPKNKINLITFQKQAIWEVPTFLQISKKRKNAKELIDLFDKGYEQLYSSGRIQKIIDETRDAILKQQKISDFTIKKY